MLNNADPFAKAEIIQSLQAINRMVADYFAGLSPAAFFTHPPEVWSPAENLQHLIQSVNPLIRVMQFPQEKLTSRFGLSSRQSRGYNDIRDTYQVELAKGAVAGGTFVPVVGGLPSQPQIAQAEIVQHWAQTSQQLVEVVNGWNESDLDIYQIPHPLLNLLTVREILLFTLYHNRHHLEDARRLVLS